MSGAAAEPCPRCGAPGSGFVCAYCGAELHPPGDERAELAALDEYHKHVEAAGSNPEHCSRLIAHGWTPTATKPLIEAGLRCLPRIDLEAPGSSCHSQWAARLESIAVRLRLTGGPEGEKAAAEFEEKIRGWRARSDHDTRMGCGCLLILGLLIALAVWKVVAYFR